METVPCQIRGETKIDINVFPLPRNLRVNYSWELKNEPQWALWEINILYSWVEPGALPSFLLPDPFTSWKISSTPLLPSPFSRFHKNTSEQSRRRHKTRYSVLFYYRVADRAEPRDETEDGFKRSRQEASGWCSGRFNYVNKEGVGCCTAGFSAPVSRQHFPIRRRTCSSLEFKTKKNWDVTETETWWLRIILSCYHFFFILCRQS